MDRNTSIDNITQGVFKSLSARRAWIEITAHTAKKTSIAVALRKESVDRNVPGENLINGICLSLSARRAWIEIILFCWAGSRMVVALRKESVDRNIQRTIVEGNPKGRSPQGERG